MKNLTADCATNININNFLFDPKYEMYCFDAGVYSFFSVEAGGHLKPHLGVEEEADTFLAAVDGGDVERGQAWRHA